MQTGDLGGRSILVVEDEPLIALNIAEAFRKAGATVWEARSLDIASDLIDHRDISAAVMDFGFGKETSHDLCSKLKKLGVPFVLHSGYTHVDPECDVGIVIPKPADPDTIVDTVLATLLSKRTR